MWLSGLAEEEDDAAPEQIFGEGFDPMSLLDQLGQHEQDFDPDKQSYGVLRQAMDRDGPSLVKVQLCLAPTECPCMQGLFIQSCSMWHLCRSACWARSYAQRCTNYLNAHLR